MDDPPIVRVVWADSHAYGGWKIVEEWAAHITPARMVCESVGWLLIDGRDYLVLAQSRGNRVGEATWADMVQIPRVAVRTVTPLVTSGKHQRRTRHKKA
jgi:hypothetical protein